MPLFGKARETRVGLASLLCPLALLLRLAALGGSMAGPVQAQVDGIGEPLDPGPVFTVSRFVLQYRDPQPDHPPLEELLPITVLLGTSPSGFVAYSPDRPSSPMKIGESGPALPYHPGAIGVVTASVLAVLQQRGLIGVYVEPDPDEFDIENERDLRPAGRTDLTLVIRTARVRSLRTIGGGDRIDDDWRIDNEIHDRIRTLSPIQPTGADDDDTTDLANKKILDDYLFRLNRHPGRRVDAAIAPSESGDGVSLDYLVHESKPWYVYAQVSNTGTSSTGKWQQRFGYVNNQLTDRDDTFSFEYFRSGLNDLNGVSFSYEAPWFDAERPWWWNRPSDGPDWLDWWDRSVLPWFGSNSLRWRVWGHYLDYEADLELGSVGDEIVDGSDWDLGAQLIYNVFQYRSFFVDFLAGVDARGVVVDNDASIREARHFFLLPRAGLDIERVTPVSSLLGGVGFEGNVLSRQEQTLNGGDPAGGLEALGRSDPDDKWIVLDGDFLFTQFLEPLLNPKGWQDPSTTTSSTLAHEIALLARGQYAFGNRLIPQAERVVGGLYSVRGYRQSAAVGDDFLVGTFEYRFHLPHSLPVDREPLNVPLLGGFRFAPQQVYGRPDWDFIIRGFVDAGVARSNRRPARDSASGVRLEPGEFLLGAGVGAEFLFRSNLRARVDWATALKDTQSTVNRVDAGDHEFHLLFTILY